MTLEDYLVLMSSMQSPKGHGSLYYDKPILLITLIEMIDKGVVRDNLFYKDDEVLIRAFRQVGDCCVDFQSSKRPSLQSAFVDFEDDLFWHRKIKNQNVVYFDDELYDLLLVKDVRDQVIKFILKTYLKLSFECYTEQRLNYVSLAGTIYEDGILAPSGKLLLTSKPQWDELSPAVMSVFNESYLALKEVLTNEGCLLLSRFAQDSEFFYDNILLNDLTSYIEEVKPLKRPILNTLNQIEENVLNLIKYSCILNLIRNSRNRIDSLEDVEAPSLYVIGPEINVEEKKIFQTINTPDRCVLLVDNEIVYESIGSLFVLDGSVYLVQDNNSSISVFDIETDGDIYYTGRRILISVLGSDLITELGQDRTEILFDEIVNNDSKTFKIFKCGDQWYNHQGYYVDSFSSTTNVDDINSSVDPIVPFGDFKYKPVGKLSRLEMYTKSPYVYLLLMALTDKLNRPIQEQPNEIDLDDLAISMIANVWELLYKYKEKRSTFHSLTACIENLICNECQRDMPPLSWYSSKDYVYKVLTTISKTGLFRDTIEMLQSGAPFSLLRAWIDSKDKVDIMFRSQMFEDNCLYAIRIDSRNNCLVINPRKKRMLAVEHDAIILYSGKKFLGIQ